jgi:hypothetical protein
MPNVYVAARPKGRPEGSPINDHVVEDHADHVLHTAKTQHEAVAWEKQEGHHPVVARVRHLNDKKTRIIGATASAVPASRLLFRRIAS